MNRLLAELRGTVSARAGILEDIRLDIENLLNTRNSFRKALADSYPEASRSILSYGLPDSEDPWFSERHGLEELRRNVEQALKTFEPRIDGVRVRVVEAPRSRSPQRVLLEITATVTVGDASEGVVWDSVLDGGHIEVRTG